MCLYYFTPRRPILIIKALTVATSLLPSRGRRRKLSVQQSVRKGCGDTLWGSVRFSHVGLQVVGDPLKSFIVRSAQIAFPAAWRGPERAT